MRRGFTVGDPRASAAGKKGQARSRQTRRAAMWRRFSERANAATSPFDAFLLGWEAHRRWSAQQRWSRKQAA